MLFCSCISRLVWSRKIESVFVMRHEVQGEKQEKCDSVNKELLVCRKLSQCLHFTSYMEQKKCLPCHGRHKVHEWHIMIGLLHNPMSGEEMIS